MFYTYILKSLQDGKKYIGSTSNLRHRLQLHNEGKVLSTRNRKPFKLIYFETFETMSEARWRERRFKRSHDLLERAMRKAGASMPGKEAAGPVSDSGSLKTQREGLWPGGR